MSSPVLICSSSFGAQYVLTHGHAKVAELTAKAGAYGIEVRQELVSPIDQPFEELSQTIKSLSLDIYYSSTELLWLGEHLNDNIQTSIESANALGAALLKVGIGNLPTDESVLEKSVSSLKEWLGNSELTIALENDQTKDGGLPDTLLKAYDVLHNSGINTQLVFDTGNWRWLGIDPTDAAREVGNKVGYVHCKGIRKEGQNLHAAPPSAPELATWSNFWTSFKKSVPRGIEFPLVEKDDPNADDSTLITAAKGWITRLGHL